MRVKDFLSPALPSVTISAAIDKGAVAISKSQEKSHIMIKSYYFSNRLIAVSLRRVKWARFELAIVYFD